MNHYITETQGCPCGVSLLHYESPMGCSPAAVSLLQPPTGYNCLRHVHSWIQTVIHTLKVKSTFAIFSKLQCLRDTHRKTWNPHEIWKWFHKYYDFKDVFKLYIITCVCTRTHILQSAHISKFGEKEQLKYLLISFTQLYSVILNALVHF